MSDYPSDDLGWLMGLLVERAAGRGTLFGICAKAIRRAHYQLQTERARANPAPQEPPRRKTRPGEYREGGGNPEWDDEAQPWCGPSAEWSERHDPVINAVRAFMETTESDTGVPFMRMVNAFNDYDARIIAEAEPQEPPTVEHWSDYAPGDEVGFPGGASIVPPAEPTEAPKPTSGDKPIHGRQWPSKVLWKDAWPDCTERNPRNPSPEK